jgi:hypothetical protein
VVVIASFIMSLTIASPAFRTMRYASFSPTYLISGRLFPSSHIVFSLCLSVSLVFLIEIVSMTGIVSSARIDNVDVVATNFIPMILFGVFSVRYIELMYPEGIQQL